MGLKEIIINKPQTGLEKYITTETNTLPPNREQIETEYKTTKTYNTQPFSTTNAKTPQYRTEWAQNRKEEKYQNTTSENADIIKAIEELRNELKEMNKKLDKLYEMNDKLDKLDERMTEMSEMTAMMYYKLDKIDKGMFETKEANRMQYLRNKGLSMTPVTFMRNCMDESDLEEVPYWRYKYRR